MRVYSLATDKPVALRFQIIFENLGMLFFRRGENQSIQRKIFWSNPHMMLGPGINLGLTGGRPALSPLQYSCSPE